MDKWLQANYTGPWSAPDFRPRACSTPIKGKAGELAAGYHLQHFSQGARRMLLAQHLKFPTPHPHRKGEQLQVRLLPSYYRQAIEDGLWQALKESSYKGLRVDYKTLAVRGKDDDKEYYCYD